MEKMYQKNYDWPQRLQTLYGTMADAFDEEPLRLLIRSGVG